MSVIPDHLYTKELLSSVDRLICDGYTNFSDLSRADQDNLISHCISALGDDSYTCLFDEIDTVMNKFKRCVITRSSSNMADLFESMHELATNHFENDIDAIFSDRIGWNNFINQSERGYRNVFATTEY